MLLPAGSIADVPHLWPKPSVQKSRQAGRLKCRGKPDSVWIKCERSADRRTHRWRETFRQAGRFITRQADKFWQRHTQWCRQTHPVPDMQTYWRTRRQAADRQTKLQWCVISIVEQRPSLDNGRWTRDIRFRFGSGAWLHWLHTVTKKCMCACLSGRSTGSSTIGFLGHHCMASQERKEKKQKIRHELVHPQTQWHSTERKKERA